MLKLLLSKGGASPVDTCKKNHVSPIHIAAELGHLDCVKLLLEYGSPDRPKDSEANIPAMLAEKNKNFDIVEYLGMFVVIVRVPVHVYRIFPDKRRFPYIKPRMLVAG